MIFNLPSFELAEVLALAKESAALGDGGDFGTAVPEWNDYNIIAVV
jgi:hypothetical protein